MAERYRADEVVDILFGDGDFDFEDSDLEEDGVDDDEDWDPLPTRSNRSRDDEADASEAATDQTHMTAGDVSSEADEPAASSALNQKAKRAPSKNFIWAKNRNPRPSYPIPNVFGPEIRDRKLERNATPIDCFLALFPIEALTLMVEMTNKNYRRRLAMREAKRHVRGGTTVRQRSHQIPWTDVTMPELKTFIGLSLAMGVLRLPRLAMYWRKPPHPFSTWLFGNTMSRDRYLGIYRHFHFSQPVNAGTEQPTTSTQCDRPTDKLRKVRTFIEMIRRKCMSVYSPRRELSIDESMIPFKGRIAWKQQLPAKRTRYGMKVFVLAEAETGYVSNFSFYVGEEVRDSKYEHLGVSGQIVFDLLEQYLGVGYHVYMDNYYTSPHLLDELFQQNTYGCGTVRSNRKAFPKDLLIKVVGREAVARGYMDWRMSTNGPVLCYCWNDNKAVYMMSTIHDPEPDDVKPTLVKRRRRSRNDSGLIPRPPIVQDYNNYMRGVDFNDQLRKYYNINRKARMWYKKVYGYILEVCVHNARVLYETSHEKICPIQFREKLIMALIGNSLKSEGHRFTSPASDSLRLQGVTGHMPIMVDSASRCRCCRERAKAAKQAGHSPEVKKQTKVKCVKCNEPLCFTRERNCFKRWHQDKELWP